MKTIYISWFLVMAFCTAGKGQTIIPIKAGIIIEQISLPKWPRSPHHLGYGFILGSEFGLLRRNRLDLIQTVDCYFFSHAKYGTSFLVASNLGLRFKPGKIQFDFKLGPGYLLFVNHSPIYSSVGGHYEKRSGIQNKFALTTGLSASYTIGSFKPYFGYNLMVETPFIQNSSAILPHQMLEMGVIYPLKTSKNEKQ